MNRNVIRNVTVPALIVLVGALTLQAVHRQQSTAVNERRFSERVNLALRRTAHQLLALAGNHTSPIAPVEQDGNDTWIVRLEQTFDYDSLPPLLRESFALHGVEGHYNVAVLDCQTDDLTLGYTASTSRMEADVPCGGRDQTAGCYNLRVTFPDRDDASAGQRWWLWLAAAGLFLFVYWLFLRFSKLKMKVLEGEQLPSSPLPEAVPPVVMLRFGQSALDMTNQKLMVKKSLKDLTYREAKLLQLFARNINQLLSRDVILQSVWQDEGILVGRSVDVFVSRLRKLLHDDETLRILNVHGVGYRLELRGEEGGY